MKKEDEDLKYILEHVFLPPQLPQEHDRDTHRKDLRLLEYVINTAETFSNTLAKSVSSSDSREARAWGIIQRMLKATRRLYAGGSIIQDALKAALGHMNVDGRFHSPQKTLSIQLIGLIQMYSLFLSKLKMQELFSERLPRISSRSKPLKSLSHVKL